MSQTISVKITIIFDASDKNHNDRGFYSQTMLPNLKSSRKVSQDTIGEYHYSTIITVKKVIIIMINMAM